MDVTGILSDLVVLHGVPGHVRTDNGPEFVAKSGQDWIAAVGAKTVYIAPGIPWENGFPVTTGLILVRIFSIATGSVGRSSEQLIRRNVRDL